MSRMKQSLKNIFFGLGFISQLTPELLIFIYVKELFAAALPFVNIIFTQLMIDMLTGSEENRVVFCAVTAVVLNAVLLLLIALLSRSQTKANAKFNLLFDKKLNFHQMEYKFGDLESNRIKELQIEIEQTKMRNGSVGMVVANFEVLTRNILNLFIATLSLFRVFKLHRTIERTSFWIGPWSLIILLSLTIFTVAFSFRMQARQNVKISDLNRQANQANGDAFSYMQLISDYHFGKDIRVHDLKSFLCNAFNNLWKSSAGRTLTKKLGHAKATIPCIVVVCDSILTILIYLLVLMKAIADEITPGAVVLYIGSIQVFTQSVTQLVNSIGEMTTLGELLSPFLTLLNNPVERSVQNKRISPACAYTLTFEDVSFQYPDTEAWALQNVSFTLEHAQRTALVGANGSGKSTAVKLLCRLYDPQKGRITLNGVDIREFDLKQYRKIISTVFQDFSLLSFKFGENIACSDSYADEQVLSVALKVGLSGWMAKRADPINTYLFHDYGMDGVEISGGEAQKTAIARAVYKNGSVVVLDEPTAALDPRSEAEVYENFNKLIPDKSAIYISHRLSSCRFCDNIIVFDCGRLVQLGTHRQLVDQSGQYQKLWNAQAELYAKNDNLHMIYE